MIKKVLTTMVAAFCSVGALEASAAEIECSTIEFIVPFSAGGGTDIMARSLTPGIEKASGVPTQVINLIGGDGVVGKKEVMQRPADGCTLLAVTLDFVIFEANGNEAANLLDLQPLYRAHVDLGALHAGADGEIKNWEDAKSKAQSDEGPLLVGGLSPASFDEAAVKILLGGSDVPFRYIPYDNSGEMHADLMGGRIHLMYEEISVAKPLIEAGQITPVVLAYNERLDSMPDVPAAEEIGLAVSPPIWRGVAVNKDTPPATVAALEQIMVEAAKSPEYADFAEQRGLTIVDGSLLSERFTESVTEERGAFAETLAE